jgi:uncharacterized protein (DUF488 family)
MRVWSIGHSTHPPERFLELLAAHEVRRVADVRRFPGSRRYPWFASEALAAWLGEAGVAYAHLPALGGRRSVAPESPNGGWRVRAFQGYADYAMGDAFAVGLSELVAPARGERTVMMCSEALWWRCHRRLIADRLVAGGDEVLHIGADGRTTAHELTPFARPGPGGALVYPPR